ncbi:finger Noc-like [Octopus vulgaris]|uniref:Finger Noc-like n=1 Tax=Octopus vulgaris TaxID=6645 RepID=A0AA36ARU2_OCTVU|nr:finger Noc-like [Octopus vulgaris]
MLTPTSTQYHYPEYLQPLPTTLDAKKSPLALLAQTCSSIGKDTSPSSKQIIPPIEKKENGSSDLKEKSLKDLHHSEKSIDIKRNSENGEKKESGRESGKPGFRTIPPKEIPPLVPISSSSSERTSVSSPTTEVHSGSHKSSSSSSSLSSSESSVNCSSISRPMSANCTSASLTSSGRMSMGSVSDLSHPDSAGITKTSLSQHTPSLLTHSSLVGGGLKSASHPSLLSTLPAASLASYGCLPLVGHGIPMDAAGNSPVYPSHLAAHAGLSLASAAAAVAANSSPLKLGAQPSAVSPYFAYARVRTPTGATTLVPVCRDPYCTNCQMTLQNAHLSSTCTSPGCTQCAHEKSLLQTSSLGLTSAAGLPMLSSVSTLGTPGAALTANPSLGFGTSFYPHSMLGTQLPYICSWVAGNDYCGKRFSTSEELLQHLRTHTTVNDTAALAASYNLSFPSVSLPSCHGQYTTTGSISPNSLRRTYPTSISPVGSLLSAARYHPYKTPYTSVPSGVSGGIPLNSIGGAYLSPYSTLYGHRLGAAAVP